MRGCVRDCVRLHMNACDCKWLYLAGYGYKRECKMTVACDCRILACECEVLLVAWRSYGEPTHCTRLWTVCVWLRINAFGNWMLLMIMFAGNCDWLYYCSGRLWFVMYRVGLRVVACDYSIYVWLHFIVSDSEPIFTIASEFYAFAMTAATKNLNQENSRQFSRILNSQRLDTKLYWNEKMQNYEKILNTVWFISNSESAVYFDISNEKTGACGCECEWLCICMLCVEVCERLFRNMSVWERVISHICERH